MVTPSKQTSSRVQLVFFRTATGSEPVREWLKFLPAEDRAVLGMDLMQAQWCWPVGMPLCRPMGDGLFEIRTVISSRRIARIFIASNRGVLVALHGFIKKS